MINVPNAAEDSKAYSGIHSLTLEYNQVWHGGALVKSVTSQQGCGFRDFSVQSLHVLSVLEEEERGMEEKVLSPHSISGNSAFLLQFKDMYIG